MHNKANAENLLLTISVTFNRKGCIIEKLMDNYRIICFIRLHMYLLNKYNTDRNNNKFYYYFDRDVS